MYYNTNIRFSPHHFRPFFELVDHYNDFFASIGGNNLHLRWIKLAFFGMPMYMFHATNLVIVVMSMVTKNIWVEVVESMKG
jgi:hypothetical protein